MHAEKAGVILRQATRWCEAENGATSIEYALIGVLIAVVIVGAVTSVGLEVQGAFDFVASCVANLECP